jgi:hypothetical protein
MTADDEIVLYLGLLIEHREHCDSDGCSTCLTLQNIVAVIKHRIFSGPIYEEQMLARRSPLRPKSRLATSRQSQTRRQSVGAPPEDLDQECRCIPD